MKLIFKVDQAESLRRGVDAPHSTVTLDIDPAKLTEEERGFLSANLLKGHSLERVSLCEGEFELPTPDVVGLKALLGRTLASNRLRADKIQELRAGILSGANKIRGCDANCVTVDGFPAHSIPIDKELAPVVSAWRLQRATDEKREIERLRALGQRYFSTHPCLAAQKFEIQATLNAEGICDLIREGERESRTVSFTGGAEDWDRKTCEPYGQPLTDSEFAKLKLWLAKLPDGIKPSFWLMKSPREYNRLIAKATWDVEGIEVVSDTPIGEFMG